MLELVAGSGRSEGDLHDLDKPPGDLLLDDDLFDADNVLDLDVPLLMTVASASIFSGTSIFRISTISKQLK